MTDDALLLDRRLGCLLAGAVGDALGAPIEFLRWHQIKSRFGPDGVTDYVDDGGRGIFTDDTQMTLFTAEGAIRAIHRARERGMCDVPSVVTHSLLRWLVTQDGDGVIPAGKGEHLLSGWMLGDRRLHRRRAPGNTCLAGLRTQLRVKLEGGAVPDPVNDSFGCGGVMRAAPLGLAGHHDPFGLASECAALTHGHRMGYQPAGLLAEICHQVLQGAPLGQAVRGVYSRRRDALHPGLIEVFDRALALADAAGQEATPELIESLGGAWTGHEALAISVYCALIARDLEHGLLLSVNHGGDSDSTGSIVGNLLGAAHGVAAIPERWLDGLDARDLVEQVARDLHEAASGGEIDPEKYPPY